MLGHTRLRVLDLSEAGAQPMGAGSPGAWVVFNGEIYNHRDLRKRLEMRGHVFRGRSDTEIIPRLFREEGPAFVKLLQGMFAIAVFDEAAGELYLYRDRFGIKPLLYAADGENLAFASEIGALREVPWVDFEPDPQALRDFLGLRYVPAPHTFFKGVRALEPGQVLRARVGPSGLETRILSYHRWDLSWDESLEAEAVRRETWLRLQKAVVRQLEAHVPLGGFLSGGVDSSLVCAVASDALERFKTFNLRFPDPGYDETESAVAVARHIGSIHTVLEMDSGRRDWETLRRLLVAPGQPFSDTSLLGVNAVCHSTRRHLTVALSGDGGDEGFAGYEAYLSLWRTGRFRRLPKGIRKLARILSRGLQRGGIMADTTVERLSVLTELDEVALVERQFRALTEEDVRNLLIDGDGLPVRRLFEPSWSQENLKGRGLVDRLFLLATEANIRLTLANDFLPKVDAASMVESLEVRVPMLDEELMAFALRIPWWLKVSSSGGKIPLREVAHEVLPEHVANRRKHGFGVPLDLWFTATLKKELESAMLGPESPLHGVFRPEVFVPWVRAFSSEKQVPGLSRAGLHLRFMMLLTVFLFLSGKDL